MSIEVLNRTEDRATVLRNNKEITRKIYNINSEEIIYIKGEKFPLEAANKTEKKPEFNINERFSMLENFVDMVLKGLINSALITGQGGLGKSHTVLSRLDKFNLVQEEDYVIVKGYSTPKALYATLYNNQNKIIIFDDCDSVLKDPIALNILKGALDTYERRTISWNSKGFVDDGLPECFDFNGQVIFISNLNATKVDQAVRSRAISVDVSMNSEEKIQRIENIKEHILPEYSNIIKDEIIEFLKENIKLTNSFNIRTFQNLLKVHDQFSGKDWKTPAKYILVNS